MGFLSRKEIKLYKYLDLEKRMWSTGNDNCMGKYIRFFKNLDTFIRQVTNVKMIMIIEFITFKIYNNSTKKGRNCRYIIIRF